MSALNLGGIPFAIDDLPEGMNLGGIQQLAIRQFPGGGLDVQPLGAYDDPIQWEAVFQYGDALDRAQEIDDMRIQGEAVALQVGRITRSVIISKFAYTYQNDHQVPYSIELQPLTAYGSNVTVNGLPDNTVATFSIESPSSETATVQATPTPVPTPTPSPQKTYTIVSGDTLWGIASRFYGSGSQWTKIADANKSTIPNPNLIYPGQTIVIP